MIRPVAKLDHEQDSGARLAEVTREPLDDDPRSAAPQRTNPGPLVVLTGCPPTRASLCARVVEWALHTRGRATPSKTTAPLMRFVAPPATPPARAGSLAGVSHPQPFSGSRRITHRLACPTCFRRAPLMGFKESRHHFCCDPTWRPEGSRERTRQARSGRAVDHEREKNTPHAPSSLHPRHPEQTSGSLTTTTANGHGGSWTPSATHTRRGAASCWKERTDGAG